MDVQPIISVIELRKTPWLDGSAATTFVERLQCTRGYPDVYLEHQAIWQLVDRCQNDGTRPEFLYRLENGGDFWRVVLMSDRALSEHSKPVPTLATGTPVAWKLRANPTADIGGHRTPILTPGGLQAWATRKLSPGLEISELNFAVQPPNTGYRYADRLTIHAVEFAGTATVTDPAALRDLLLHGVGRSKRFGFGLLFWKYQGCSPRAGVDRIGRVIWSSC
jgi:CRISPR-associated protein Cas6/Cse3/CasE subtype I-E